MLERSQVERILVDASVESELGSIELLGDGAKSDVLSLELLGADPLALKVYKRETSARREHAAYRVIAEAGLPLPRKLAGEESADFAKDGYTLMTLAPGAPMNAALRRLPRARLEAIYRDLGELLAQIARHRLPSFTLVAGRTDGFATNFDFMYARLRASIEGFLAGGGSPYISGAVDALFAERKDAINACTDAVLCHGDLHPENVRISGKPANAEFVGAIDLEEAFAGDPALDIVRTIHTTPVLGEALLAPLLDGYGEPPSWFAEVYEPYFLYWELELWNFFAAGGSRRPLRSISRRIARRLELPRAPRLRSRVRRVISRQA